MHILRQNTPAQYGPHTTSDVWYHQDYKSWCERQHQMDTGVWFQSCVVSMISSLPLIRPLIYDHVDFLKERQIRTVIQLKLIHQTNGTSTLINQVGWWDHHFCWYYFNQSLAFNCVTLIIKYWFIFFRP